MGITGSIAANPHEGTRSEYLAQYVFSAFGVSSPVPHPEDAGIDLQCGIGERVGKRLLISDYYLVQVKSSADEIVYEGRESVKWLLSHRYPLFLAVVTKRENKISIFHTLPVTMCFAKKQLCAIKLVPGGKEATFEGAFLDADLTLNLGPPILQFNINELADPEYVQRSKRVLRSWIMLDQANIDQKHIGYTMFAVPKSYSTNDLVTPGKLVGNFKDVDRRTPESIAFFDTLWKLLSQLIHQAAAEKDEQTFKLVCDISAMFLQKYPSVSTIWLVNLAFSINAGAEHGQPISGMPQE